MEILNIEHNLKSILKISEIYNLLKSKIFIEDNVLLKE